MKEYSLRKTIVCEEIISWLMSSMVKVSSKLCFFTKAIYDYQIFQSLFSIRCYRNLVQKFKKIKTTAFLQYISFMNVNLARMSILARQHLWIGEDSLVLNIEVFQIKFFLKIKSLKKKKKKSIAGTHTLGKRGRLDWWVPWPRWATRGTGHEWEWYLSGLRIKCCGGFLLWWWPGRHHGSKWWSWRECYRTSHLCKGSPLEKMKKVKTSFRMTKEFTINLNVIWIYCRMYD